MDAVFEVEEGEQFFRNILVSSNQLFYQMSTVKALLFSF